MTRIRNVKTFLLLPAIVCHYNKFFDRKLPVLEKTAQEISDMTGNKVLRSTHCYEKSFI